MAEDPLDLALKAYGLANRDVQKIMLAHALKRVESEAAGNTTIQTRLSSSAALLFAGAAVSTTLTATNVTPHPLAAKLTAVAALLFVLGGCVCLLGLRTRKTKFAGDLPSWWLGHGAEPLKALDEVEAGRWLAINYEEAARDLREAAHERSRALNLGVLLGAIAGLLVAGAALSLAFR